MYINVVHRYSRFGDKVLSITYNALLKKITGTLQFCDGCAISKAESRAERKDFC